MTASKDIPWFVAQLRPQGLSLALIHLHRQGFETFAPEQSATTVKAGAKVQTRRPLFPGYLFVSFDPEARGWTAINATRGVSRLIVNDPRRPAPLPAALVAGLMARCDSTGLLLQPANLQVGDKIRIVAGPFAELVTQIETLPDQERIGILVDLLGRKVRTSLSRAQIEKLD